MSEVNIIIDTAQNYTKYTSTVGMEKRKWVFMGSNPLLKEKIRKTLGVESNYSFAYEFQDLCFEKKQEFLDLIADFVSSQKDPAVHATSLAHKSPFDTDIFQNYCFYNLIKRWVAEKKNKLLIFIENPLLLKACQNLASNDCEVRLARTSFLFNFKSSILLYVHLAYHFIEVFYLWTYSKIIYRNKRQKMQEKLNKANILFFSWIELRSFKTDAFEDPYLGKLNQYCADFGHSSIYLSLPSISKPVLKIVLNSDAVYPSIDFLYFRDIFSCLLKVLTFRWKRTDTTEQFSYIFKSGIKKYNKQSMFSALLHYKACLRLFDMHAQNSKYIIYTFENQPWDKMMVLAAKASQKKRTTIAYQHATIPYLLLSHYLGATEKQSSPQPDIILSNGAHWEQVLKDGGFISKIYNGGSLRYTYNKNISCNIKNDSNNSNVLVILSASMIQILDMLFYLINNNVKDKNFMIKPHPDIPEAKIRQNMPHMPDNFSFINGTMDECMSKVAFAMHDGSTAAFECMLNGISVIKYLPERVDMDRFFGLNFSQKVVTEKDALEFNTDDNAAKTIDCSLIAEPFNTEVWKEILK